MKRSRAHHARRAVAAGALVLAALLGGTALPPTDTSASTPVSTGAVTRAPQEPRYVPGVLLIKRRVGTSNNRVIAQAGVIRVERAVRSLGVERIAVTPGQERAVARELENEGLVEYAEPDIIRHVADIVPNDPLYGPAQWDLPKIRMPAAWEITQGSPSITVAVIDTGFDFGHPDQPAHLVSGPTYTAAAGQDGCSPAGSSPTDDNGHGTHVTGTIAAAFNNGTGVAGMAPNVTVLVIKAGDCTGNFTDGDTVAAINYAANSGARVINMSFGGPGGSQAVADAVNYAWSKGAVVVAAAGNDGQDLTSENFVPASLPNVVAVTASNSADQPAFYSNWGGSNSVAAPGGDYGAGIVSTYLPNGYDRCPASQSYGQSYYCSQIGTSMASPHVAAEAALIFSEMPGLTNAQVVSTIRTAVDPLQNVPPGEYFGSGRINVCRALIQATRQTATATVTPRVSSPAGLTRRAYLPLVPVGDCLTP